VSTVTSTAPPSNVDTNGRTDNTTPEVGVQDLFPVRSRISWGAIAGGAVVARAIYFLLTLLGTAIGASVVTNTTSERGMNALITAGVVWAVAATMIGLFVGGWVASQLSVGESPREAAVYGIVVWGTVLALLLFLLTAGVRSGFNAMIGMATVAEQAERNEPGIWEDSARRAGYTQDQIDKMRETVKDGPARALEALKDPEYRETAGRRITAAAWWTLLGTVLSMGAAIGGALTGAGPRFRLLLASHARRMAVTRV
jgi:hypothetical protein